MWCALNSLSVPQRENEVVTWHLLGVSFFQISDEQPVTLQTRNGGSLIIAKKTADRLAQLVEHRTAVRDWSQV